MTSSQAQLNASISSCFVDSHGARALFTRPTRADQSIAHLERAAAFYPSARARRFARPAARASTQVIVVIVVVVVVVVGVEVGAAICTLINGVRGP